MEQKIQEVNTQTHSLFVAGYTIADGRWVALVAGAGRTAQVGYTAGRLACTCGHESCCHVAYLVSKGLDYEIGEPAPALTARDVLAEAWAAAVLAGL